MKKIELHPIKEWEEKEGNRPTGNIRIYVGKLHVGTCHRKNKSEELYSFHSFYDGITRNMDTSTYRQLDEIKTDIDMCLKEHLTKFVKTFRTFTPLESKKIKAATKVAGNAIVKPWRPQ